MDFKELLKGEVGKIETNRTRRLEGKFNHIPSPFQKLSDFWPGLIPGDHILFTAGTGVGKSRYMLRNFVIWPVEWSIANDYNSKMIFFPLEDSGSKIIRRFIVSRLHAVYKLEIKLADLNGYVETGALDETTLKYIHEIIESDYVAKLNEKLIIVNDCFTPEQMLKRITTEMAKDGEFIFPEGITDEQKALTLPIGFKSNNNTHWLVGCDNVNNIAVGAHGNKQEAILKWCRDYVREFLCNRCLVTVVDIQQQMPTKETLMFTNTGLSMMQKLVPSVDGLNEAKATSQTAHVIFGLFSPAKYEFQTCPIGYNTGILGNYYRHLKIIKNNDGEAPVEMGLFFDGKTEQWTELPDKGDKTNMDELYKYIDDLEKFRNPKEQVQIFY